MNILKIIKSYQESKHIADEHEDKLFKMIYPNIEISRFQYDCIVEAIIKKFKKLGISYGTAKEILSTVSNKIDQEMEKKKIWTKELQNAYTQQRRTCQNAVP